MCLMSVMEFLHAEYSADHSALFRRNIRNLHYLLHWLIRVVLRVRGECKPSMQFSKFFRKTPNYGPM
jgi:hypothetical protein